MKTSSLFSLDFKDLAKGFLVAIGGAVITTVETTIQAGTSALNWHAIGGVALASGLSYLGKNFFTPEKIVTSPQ